MVPQKGRGVPASLLDPACDQKPEIFFLSYWPNARSMAEWHSDGMQFMGSVVDQKPVYRGITVAESSLINEAHW